MPPRQATRLKEAKKMIPVACGWFGAQLYGFNGWLRSVGYLQARALGKEAGTVDMYVERGRLLKLQADRAQMELDTMRARLISADEAEELWASLLATFRARMLAVPTRAAHLVLHLKEFYAIEQSLRDLVCDALTELARYDPEQQIRPESVETRPPTLEAPAEAEGEPVGG